MEVLQITKKMIEDAKELIANGQAEPVGYRILVKSIDVDTEMASGLQELAPVLAEAGFTDKTEDEAERQSRGTYFGLVCARGKHAYKAPHLGEYEWIELGDVAIFERYAGVTVELPPGSDNQYQFINDENIMGRMIRKPQLLISQITTEED